MHKLKIRLGILIFFLVAVVLIILLIPKLESKYIYPLKYEELIDKYSSEYEVDKYLIMAIIKTESGFNEKATSNVGARGLMQIMPDAFDWIKMKLNDDDNVTFDDMYDPETNIKYGTYLISFLYNRYNSESLAAAAYHAGMTKVDDWLEDNTITNNDGNIIENIPSKTTAHYVDKVTNALQSYRNLYCKE